MKYLILAILLTGCTSTTINIPAGAEIRDITVNANKAITTSPSLDARARDVQVPVGP